MKMGARLQISQQEFRGQFPALEKWTWLDTPGSPPGAAPVVAAITDVMTAWSSGDFVWLDWDAAAEEARNVFAAYAGVAARCVSVLGSVAEGAATVAATLPPGTIVVPDDDFRSTLFPWLALDMVRNPVIRVPSRDGYVHTSDMVSAIRPDTVLLAISDTLTSNGVRPDFEALRAATAEVGARLFVDITQSFAVLPFDFVTINADFVAVHGYKWMLCPRGAAWMITREDRIDELRPLLPSWKSTAAPYGYFGGKLELPDDASRSDTSPAWFSWIGSIAAIKLLASLDPVDVASHTVELAQRWWLGAVELGYTPITPYQSSHISVVDVEGKDVALIGSRLSARNVKAQLGATRLRVGIHYFNTADDVDLALEAMTLGF